MIRTGEVAIRANNESPYKFEVVDAATGEPLANVSGFTLRVDVDLGARRDVEFVSPAKAAGVRYIPAHSVASVWPREIIAAGWGIEEHPVLNLIASRKAVEAAVSMPFGPSLMWRWDCCAGYPLKVDMDRNGQLTEESKVFVVDDPRLMDVLAEDWPEVMPVHALVRPVVKAMRRDTHPVEFRVFVRDMKVVGASNYYPQVSLPTHMLPYAREAMQGTEEILKHAPLTTEQTDFTADWLVDERGLLHYLEGGPGFGDGAHPCCFKGADDITGIAMGLGDIRK